MSIASESESCPWAVAHFPSCGIRERFLDQLRVWNKVEGLPRVETRPLQDGRRVLFRSGDPRGPGILRLVESFGGRVA